MNRDQKAVAIAEIATHIDESEAIFAVDYRGITVEQVADLRTKLREADATFKVVKNSLTERAADQVGAESLKAYLAGPTALTFVRGDVAARRQGDRRLRQSHPAAAFQGRHDGRRGAGDRADPRALQTALPPGPLRPAGRGRGLAHRWPRAQPGWPARRSRRGARPGAREEGVGRDPRRRGARIRGRRGARG